MEKIVILNIILLFTITCNADEIILYRNIDSTIFSNQINTLENEYGQNLDCPDAYKLQILIALSYYEELRNIPIEVKLTNIKTTAACRPKISSMFSVFFTLLTIIFGSILMIPSKINAFYNYKSISYALCFIGFISISFIGFANYSSNSQSNRKYTISINNNNNFDGILLKDVPFNAQIGVLGHEIGHIADYESRSFIRIIGRAFDYLSDKSKKKFEYEIDMITIEHGLGWQLYDWSDYAINKSNATLEYKAFKKKIYMTPVEILTYMDSFTMYEL